LNDSIHSNNCDEVDRDFKKGRIDNHGNQEEGSEESREEDQQEKVVL
jgi:hypothetical protein